MTRRELLQSTYTNFEADKDLLTSIYQLHEYLGATKNLPSHHDKKQQTAIRAEYFNQWMIHTIIKNNRLPLDIPIGFIFVEFANGLVSGQYERKGNNIATFVEAMSKAVDDIVREWTKRNEPLKLPEKKGTKLESLPDHTIRDLFQTIQMIGGVQFNPLFQNSKAESYFNRLKSEYEARFEK
jgi:hypothetical protein